MKQSRAMSLLETVINITVGFGLGLAGQAIFLPLLGVDINWHQNLVFAGIMTFISILRGFALRRLFEALHIRVPLSSGMLAIIAERRRQIESEGWTHEHDDAHVTGELSRAGACYAYAAGTLGKMSRPPSWWPWETTWWKPVDFRRDLIKGSALILAELERFDRSRKRKPSPLKEVA